MKLAIHKSNWGFSPDWIRYCQERNIPHKIVNCYDSDIIKQIEDCEVLLWHHHHSLAKDKTFAKELLFALEQSGKKVFPEFHSGWHFDDKVAQKYLLEAVHAPYVSTDVFYNKNSALAYIENSIFPKVFKLKGGAGSSNVRLVKDETEAKKIIHKAFGKGFSSYNGWGDLKENFRRYRLGKASKSEVLKSFRRFFVGTEFSKIHQREKGYVLFQEFLPNNDHDIRVVVIGEKAFALKRLVRNGDFRASGSGFIEYDKDRIDEVCVEIAFEVSKKLGTSCLAYDFVYDSHKNPLIVEINYGFAHEAYFNCPGYWDKNLNWHEGKFNSAEWILDLFVKK